MTMVEYFGSLSPDLSSFELGKFVEDQNSAIGVMTESMWSVKASRSSTIFGARPGSVKSNRPISVDSKRMILPEFRSEHRVNISNGNHYILKYF